jgi:hypothetical protein
VRLLADDAFADDFLHLAVRVGDEPVTRDEARRLAAFVADRDGVGKHEAAFTGVRLVFDVVGR